MWILTNAFCITILSGGILYISYKLYGAFLAQRIFGADDNKLTPAVEQTDGMDFVPTKPAVLFGHHFASIAGLGPILGPAIAVYWGWLPAIVWVLAGCILIGGVHDIAALFASMRHKARSIGDLTSDIINPRVRLLFLIIIFFLLALAMGVFAITMANLFTNLSPQAVVPTFSLIAIAMVIGTLVYKFKVSLGKATVAGIVLMFTCTYLGLELPVPLYRLFVTDSTAQNIITTSDDPALPQVHGIRATRADKTVTYFQKRLESDPDNTQLQAATANVASAQQRAVSSWVYILLFYAFAASVLPVWLLLQPRDYINCFQLYFALALLLVGLAVWHPQINSPAIGSLPSAQNDASPGMMPFIFIIIACGAVSGFHSLVSSGTTARQIRKESDAQRIGYGAMLMEGFLAVLVIMACTAGLSGADFQTNYGHWSGLDGRGLGAFLLGAANVSARPFLWMFDPALHAQVTVFFMNFIAVVVVSFAMTTLDSGTRLLRYNVEEIGRIIHLEPARNRYLSSLLAVAAIGYFALIRIDGKPAGLILWQLFGTTNQLLAALGLLVASIYLYRIGKPVIYTLAPMLVMVVTVSWAMTIKLGEFYDGWHTHGDTANLSLLVIGLLLAVMAIWMMIEGALAFWKLRGQSRLPLETRPIPD